MEMENRYRRNHTTRRLIMPGPFVTVAPLMARKAMTVRARETAF